LQQEKVMANQVLALEEAYRLIVAARQSCWGAVDDKLGRVRDYIAAQLLEAVRTLEAE
jgi:hypothetical protein